MKILITDVKHRMALAAVRDLGQAGFQVHGLHFGEGAPPAFSSRFISGCHTSPDLQGKSRAEAVYSWADKLGADVIFPTGALTIAALTAHPRPGLLLPSAASLELAGDKPRLAALAEETGVAVPGRWQYPREVKDFPVVVKYANGEELGLPAGERYRIVSSTQELEDAFYAMSAIASAGGQRPALIQQFIPGGGYGVSAVFDRSGVPVSVICHQRLREFPISGGPSAMCVSIWDERLVRPALSLLRALDWRGAAMVEFRGSPGAGYHLLEINPRLWGSFPLTRAARSGFSEKYARAAAGEELPECTAPHYALGVKMGFRYMNLAAAGQYLRRGDVFSSLLAVRDAFSGRVTDGVLDSDDPEASAAYRRQALRGGWL